MSVAATTKEDRTGGAAGRGERATSIVKLCLGENREALRPPRPALATAASVPPACTEAEQRERLPGQLVSALSGVNTGLQTGLGD